jgi:hypothetical protein
LAGGYRTRRDRKRGRGKPYVYQASYLADSRREVAAAAATGSRLPPRKRRVRRRVSSPGRLALTVLILSLIIGGAAAALRPGPHRLPGPDPGTPGATVPPDEPSPAEPSQPFPAVHSVFTGLEVPEQVAARRPLAVVIDNLAAARPQAGLDRADLVYEAPAEGGITRFLAFFQRDADLIGPVRSVRPYFLDLALEFKAVVVHCGWSPQAQEDVSALKIANLNELYQGQFFRRTTDRPAPHNVYTSSALLRRGMEHNAYVAAAGRLSPVFRRVSMPAGAQAATSFTVRYPSGPVKYDVAYVFQGESYLRWTDGLPHTTAPEGRQLTADSVIVQFVPLRLIPGDPALRIDLYLVGEGRAKLFAGGKVVDATWRKVSRSAPTEFSDADGKRLGVPPGRTWIMIVPPDTTVEWK